MENVIHGNPLKQTVIVLGHTQLYPAKYQSSDQPTRSSGPIDARRILRSALLVSRYGIGLVGSVFRIDYPRYQDETLPLPMVAFSF